MSNASLFRAQIRKDDEWYTPYQLVDDELSHYSPDLRGKRILCDCADFTPDGPRAFAQWFADRWDGLGLRGLTALEFHEADLWDPAAHGRRWDFDGRTWHATDLNGSGGFDTAEADAIRADADIVATNPPFSRWSDWFVRIRRAGCGFIALANLTTVKYPRVFPAFGAREVWAGRTLLGGGAGFIRPDGSVRRFSGATWLTNLPAGRGGKKPIRFVSYASRGWPLFDQADIVCVDSMRDIPACFGGLLAVPYSFICHWDPRMPWDIIGLTGAGTEFGRLTIDGREPFGRLVVRRRLPDRTAPDPRSPGIMEE